MGPLVNLDTFETLGWAPQGTELDGSNVFTDWSPYNPDDLDGFLVKRTEHSSVFTESYPYPDTTPPLSEIEDAGNMVLLSDWAVQGTEE